MEDKMAMDQTMSNSYEHQNEEFKENSSGNIR